ncbi:hypothetical protein COCSUDRAFT_63498 [Coccomyxa subellipsoidea C-169]|uniref:Uncharacterized protein n=1 Tax=Coccomyxa subellipsoidea (strain C-169) TaxID=574566 RepID=I0YXK8_COCSC|nr:hypothetical protein COCSUDRAFT_63498 [Coccomyxa subellipsoidea C-169]EIE23127.1 hypothetical protein COCSUDRAFT_63498 [Coccomyxa subellipsoidea C-169]|eukprot:XP_005647671.1 hypothetical protein COCSUDRAFT_63498 [Coccomyxa subellipsoidea C-169]
MVQVLSDTREVYVDAGQSQALLEAGYPVQSLLLGKEHNQLQLRTCDLDIVASLLEIVSQRGEIRQHGRALLGLLTDCSSGECEPEKVTAVLTALLEQGMEFRQPECWPADDEEKCRLVVCRGRCSPFSFACTFGQGGTVKGYLAALQQIDDRNFIDFSAKDVAHTVLMGAAVMGRAEVCALLLDAGADMLAPSAWTGYPPLGCCHEPRMVKDCRDGAPSAFTNCQRGMGP